MGLLIISSAAIFVIDWNDRAFTKCPRSFSDEENKHFFHYKTVEESQEVIIRDCTEKRYKFPREQIATIKIYKNIPFLSRLLSKELTNNQILKFTSLVNNPNNFDWNETTWRPIEANYFLKILNYENKEVGRCWILRDQVSSIELRPWIPTTKYGSLTKTGKSELNAIIGESVY